MNQDRAQHPLSQRRLPGYDYSSAGIYFVTIATRYHATWLGTVVEGTVQRSEAGETAHWVWNSLLTRFSGLELDVWVVMPNHVHGLLILPDQHQHPDRYSVSQIVRTFKAASTRLIRTGPIPAFAWQPNYHEHIVRNDKDLRRIQEYILNNPLRWSLDRANPDSLPHMT